MILSLLPFALLTALLCVSCKPQITNANIDALNTRSERADYSGRKGLSPKEVEAILGQPDSIEFTSIELETQKKQIPLTRYRYQQDGQSIELHFFDNKLVNRVPHWIGKPRNDTTHP